MTLEEFNIAIQELFDLRESKKTGETLTNAEYAKLGYFKDLLNDFYKAKNSAEGITKEVRKEFAARYEEANALYLEKEGGQLTQPLTPPPTTDAPTLAINTVDKLDVTNPQKYIRDTTTASLDVDAATKTQEVGKQEGLVNEYSVIPDFVENLKNTIAQETSNAPVLAVAPVVVNNVTDEGFSAALAETMKADVSQIISETEVTIVTEHPLYTLGKGIYTDFESQLHIFNVKQDALDPNSIFIDSSINPYDVPDAYLGEAEMALLAEQAAAAAFVAEQAQALEAEQATAIESYSGGG